MIRRIARRVVLALFSDEVDRLWEQQCEYFGHFAKAQKELLERVVTSDLMAAGIRDIVDEAIEAKYAGLVDRVEANLAGRQPPGAQPPLTILAEVGRRGTR